MNTPINLDLDKREALVTWNDRGRIIVEVTPKEFLTVAGKAMTQLGASFEESKKKPNRKKTTSSSTTV